MKQNRLAFLVVSVAAFLAVAEARAQSTVEGQPSVLKEDKGQSNYVYDLKLLIKKSKDNIKGVNEKIKEQAVIKRNQQREEKAREYYEQALKLQEEGRLEEAHQLFDKAIRITEHPEMQYYIKESERRSKIQRMALEREVSDQERRVNEEQKLLMERAEASYQNAIILYKQQKFREAKDDFALVEEMYPDYKAVRSYLQIIEQDIVQSEHLDMKEQKNEIDRQQKEEEIARLREKELWRKEVDKKEQERQQQLRAQAQGVYQEALKLFDERKYAAARDKFQEVEWVVPDYKATRVYLTRIENVVQDEKKQVLEERQRALDQQRWQEALNEKKMTEERRKSLEQHEQQKLAEVKDQAEFVYVAAVALFEKDLLEQAGEKFVEVEGIYPNYKSARDYLKRIDQINGEKAQREALKKKTAQEQRIWEEEMLRRKQDKEKLKLLAAEADISYQDAMALYQTGRLIEAKEKFLEVDQRVPDYKSTRVYLNRIDQDIELLVKTQRIQDSLAAQREELEKMRMMRDKAEVIYAQAVASYDAKDFTTAKAKFLEAEGIFPDYKKTKVYLNRIDEDIRLKEETALRLAREREAETLYAQAVALYQNEQFEDAKKKFIAVEATLPNYKQTADFLGRVGDDILQKKENDLVRMKEERVKGLYAQALALYQGGEFSEAKEKFLEVEVIYPGYKDAARILGTIDVEIEKKKKELVQRQSMEAAEKLYSVAIALYQSGDYVGAKEKFIKAEVASPDYKDCLKYLGRIDGDIERKQNDAALRAKEQEAEPVYAQGLALYKDADFIEARKKFIAVQALVPSYKDTDLYLKRIDKDIPDQEARLAKEEKMRTCDVLYSEALRLYMDRRFVEAKPKFIELSALDPSYKNVRGYLSKIDNDIRQETIRQAELLAQARAEEPYAQAVTLYHDGNIQAAKEKFLEVFRSAPDYKKTRFYLARVDEDMSIKKLRQDKQRMAQAESLYKEGMELMARNKTVEAYAKFYDVEMIYPDYKGVGAHLERLRKQGAEKRIDLPKPTGPAPVVAGHEQAVALLYKEAVRSYKDKKYDKASAQFASVEKLDPGYRSTKQYLESIHELKDMAAKVREADLKAAARKAEIALTPKVEAKAVPQAPVKPKAPVKERPVEAVHEEAKNLAAVSARSNAIYQKIKSLSEDDDLSSAARTFAKVDRLIGDLEAEQRRIADRIARQKREEAAAALRLKQKEKEEALIQKKFLAEKAQALQQKADGKAAEEARDRSARLAQEQQDHRKKEHAQVDRLKDEQKEAQLKAEVLYQQALEAFRAKDYDRAHERLIETGKIFPDYKDAAKFLVRIERAQDEAGIMAEDKKDRDQIKVLAEKAAALNVDILELSQNKEYQAVEMRFNDLESILKEIKIIKVRMVERRESFSSRWEEKMTARKADVRTSTPPKTVKEGEDFIPARQKARLLFKEGQQFYGTENFAEARVKFMEVIRLDPSYKAAMTYVQRIDRILSQRDFEVQGEQQKMKQRNLPGQDNAPAATAGAVDADVVKPAQQQTDLQRVTAVSAQGVELYNARRYREARIKFEELLQIGAPAEQQKAAHYLALIEKAFEKEKKMTEAQQRAQEERFLEERRTQAKLAWERDKRQQQMEARKTRELAATQRELDIRRQQQLREIEEQNLRQRREMLERKSRELSKALDAEQQERVKFMGEAQRQDPAVDVKTSEERVIAQKIEALRLQEAMPAVTDTSAEALAKQMAQQGPDRADGKIEKQRRRIEQLESKEQRQRREKQEKQEKARRKAVEALVQEKEASVQKSVAVRQQQEDLGKTHKQRAQEDLIRRNREAVEAVLKDAPVVLPPTAARQAPAMTSAPKVIPQAPALVEQEDPESELLKRAVEQEKDRLEQQRASIRKDFQDGVERLYNEAVGLFKKKMYQEARQDFNQVDGLVKDYKNTAQYLKEIDRYLSR